jgi:penicillin-binding protein 2
MPVEGIYEDLTLVRRRARAVFLGVSVLVLLVLSYYWKIQILEHRKFSGMAEANRTRMRVLAAPRGLILDRNRIILADNRASFKVSLVRERVKDVGASFAGISRLLGIDETTLRTRVDLHKDLPLFEPIVVADGLRAEDIYPIESHRREYREIEVEAEPMSSATSRSGPQRRSGPSRTSACRPARWSAGPGSNGSMMTSSGAATEPSTRSSTAWDGCRA